MKKVKIHRLFFILCYHLLININQRKEVSIVKKVIRFGVSMEKKLLDAFDELISRKGYTNRSEAVRDLVRDYLVMEEWQTEKKEMIGAITIVYNHHKRGLLDTLIELQHHFHDLIISTMHLHLDEDNCLEISAVKGRGDKIKAVADKLISIPGIKHGKLTMTTTGKELL